MKPKKPTISGFFPFLNDWGTIGSLVASLDNTLQKITSDYEIIVVDDGSDKNSKQILRTLKRRFPKLRLITHKKNMGYGGAIKSGLYGSKKDWVFYTDGDAQYDPREVERLWRSWNHTADVINGYKIKRQDPWYRIILGKVYHYTVRFLLMTPIRDTDCDFRLIRRTVFNHVELKANSGLICSEMIKKVSDAGYVFQEVPVTHFWRTSGKSQFFNFGRTIKMAWGIVDHWYNLEFKKITQVTDLHIKYLPESIFSRIGRTGAFLFYFIGTRLGIIDLIITTNKNRVTAFACLVKRTSELLSIVVDKKHQKSGVGKFLVTQVIKIGISEKMPYLKVKCLSEKSGVNAFYKKMGFRFLKHSEFLGHDFNYYKRII